MGILDDAIREHLELKRQHGAAEDELDQLEGEAFGPTERPGSEAASEAPTEFMVQPDADEGGSPTEADTQDGPADAKAEAAAEQPRTRQEHAAGIADLQEAPEPKREEPDEEAVPSEPVGSEQAEKEAPSTPLPEPVEEAPAMEHEAIPEPPVAAPEPPASQGPSTEERQAIADPATELYDVEGEEFSSGSKAPSDEELVAEEIEEPRLAPVEPLPKAETINLDEGDEPDFRVTEVDDEEDEDNFFDEKRLSDELDQALDVPLKPAPAEESTEEPLPELDSEPDEAVAAPDIEPEAAGESAQEDKPPAPRSDEDVLEETPDFLEEAPEDDQLWFEQKPPKDFDFDD